MISFLIVDDEKNVRYLTRISIVDAGFQDECIYEADCGTDCLEKFRKHAPAVVITDIVMPDMNGIELLGEIKKESPETPVIMLSAYEEFQYAKEALKLGAFDYLLKPVSGEEIKKVLERVMQYYDDITRNDNRLSELKSEVQRYKNRIRKYKEQIIDLPDENENEFEDIMDSNIIWIKSHYNMNITLREMARKSYMCETYFSEQFKLRTGKNFSEYLNDLRIEKSLELLKRPGLKVAEVGELVGYNNSSYFIKIFRKKMGVTPSDYRKSHKK
jgi:two-component system, response regulator YesN